MDDNLDCRDSGGNDQPIVVEVMIVALVSLVTVGGNSLTLTTFIGSRYLRNAHGLIIISLAFSDLGIGVVGLLTVHPTAVQSWPYETTLCTLQGYFFEVCHTNSFFLTIYLSVERYLAVIHPLKYTKLVTRETVFVVLVITWVVPFLGFGVPSLVRYFTYQFNGPISTCQVNWRQLNSLPIGAVFIWCLFTVFNFGLVTYTCARVSMTMKGLAVKRQSTHTGKTDEKAVKSRGVRQAITTFKISVVILVAFYLLRAPYIVTILITGVALERCAIPELLLFSTYWISMVDGCFNFFVYVVMNKNFRREFRRLILRQECQPPREDKTPTNDKSDPKFRSIAMIQQLVSSIHSTRISEESIL